MGAPTPLYLSQEGREALHYEVRRLATAAGRRRSEPLAVHVGHPTGERRRIDPADGIGPALARDLITRCLETCEADAATVWLTRYGALSVGDHELLWLSAASDAWQRAGRPLLDAYLVTRHGWLELRGLESRRWARVRHLPA